MNRGQIAVLMFGAAVALLISWVLPRLEAPPDRFSVAMDLLADGRASAAIHLLDEQVWRGIAEYRAERYRRAASDFVQDKGVMSTYNLGTAYARLGEWSAARAAYERVLSLDPGHEDAAYNHALVLAAEARQQQEQEDQRQTRTLGSEKGTPGRPEAEGGSEGEKTTTEDASPSGDVAPSDRDGTRAGQIAEQGRTGEEAASPDAAAGRAEAEAIEDRDSSGQDGAGGMRRLTRSAQDVEILLRAIRDDPARVLAARLRAMHRRRQEAGR